MSAIFNQGTMVFFNNTTAPTGWTKSTSSIYENCTLRVVSGSVSSGGSTTFTSRFSNSSYALSHSLSLNTSTEGHLLNADRLPAHTHSHFGGSPQAHATLSPLSVPRVGSVGTGTSSNTGGFSSHAHPITFPNSAFTITFSTDMSVRYVDFIVASKDA